MTDTCKLDEMTEADEAVTQSRQKGRRKVVVGGILSRQLCLSLDMMSIISEEALREHEVATGLLVQQLVVSEMTYFSTRHRSRLLKAALTAQDRGISYPALDNALVSHAWDHLQVVVQRMADMEALQPDSCAEVLDGWARDVELMRRMIVFVLRGRQFDSQHHERRDSHRLLAGSMVKAASVTYPRGDGRYEVQDANDYVRTILDSYVRSVASVYSTIDTDVILQDTEIFDAFIDMVRADASRCVILADTRRVDEQHVIQPHYGQRFEVEDICVYPGEENVDVWVEVDRLNIVTSSFEALMGFSNEQWRECESLDLRFNDETGVGEGVVRDWIGELCEKLFYKSGLFTPCPDDPAAIHPNMELPDDMETYIMMDFAGRIIGVARRLGIPTGVRLSNAAVTMVTLQPLDLRFLAELDPPLATSCAAVRLMEEAEVDLGTFVSPEMGCELFPGGALVTVGRMERKAFADLLSERHIRGRHLCGMKACHWILRGMLHVMASDDSDSDGCDIYAQIIHMKPDMFNATFGGRGLTHDVDVDEWRLHTTVSTLMTDAQADCHLVCIPVTSGPGVIASAGHMIAEADMTSNSSSEMLFHIIRELTPCDRRKFLRFWAGTSSLPIDGFSGLSGRLKLVLNTGDVGDRGRLPSAHTCVRTLVLPFYESVQAMRSAIDTCLLSMEFDETG